MAWTIYRAIKNRHIVNKELRQKRRKGNHKRRAGSFDSRRTIPNDFLSEANEYLQTNKPLDFNLDKRRAESYDNMRDTATDN